MYVLSIGGWWKIICYREKIVKKSKVKKFLQAKIVNAIKLSNKNDKNNNKKHADNINVHVSGERIVSLKYMAKNMFCHKYNNEFVLSSIVGEKVQGWGSVF